MRIKFLALLFLLLLAVITARLFYWQIISGPRLAAAARLQRSVARVVPAQRGEILSRDGKILVSNEPGYLLFASTVDLKEGSASVARKLAPIVWEAETKDREELRLPAGSTLPELKPDQVERSIVAKLSQKGNFYIPLAHRLKQTYADQIEKLGIFGLGFDPEPRRLYPEGSLAATVLGFVGKDDSGNPKGYFGLEGFYNDELTGVSGQERLERDAAGRPILIGNINLDPPRDGQSLTTTIDRYIQVVVERHLAEGLEKYGAKKASAIVMDPKTGEILAAATLPALDQRGYNFFDQSLYKDDAVSDTYETGSTFKVVTMSAGLDLGLVTPDTVCGACGGPFEVQGHAISTWNNKYYPVGETMTKVLEHSNNVGAAWLASKIGRDRFWDYAKLYGVGDKTGIDLQGEEGGVFYKSVKEIAPIDLATASFGQGFTTTALKMMQIVGTVANSGKMMQPHLVKASPKVVREVIKPQTASVLTQMLEAAVEHGEAHRIIPLGYRVAGKTGTAQVPIAGHYDPKKTVASFVGFGPVEDPKFVMIVKYVEPTASPFGAETAVPTFFDITKDLYGYLGVAANP